MSCVVWNWTRFGNLFSIARGNSGLRAESDDRLRPSSLSHCLQTSEHQFLCSWSVTLLRINESKSSLRREMGPVSSVWADILAVNYGGGVCDEIETED